MRNGVVDELPAQQNEETLVKLSIFLAGFRPEKWLGLYESIPNATTLTDKEYELVFVGPYGLPPELQNKENVRFIEDWGCPTRCYQLGLLHSQGEYVVYIADDALCSPTLAIDKAFDIIPTHKKGIVGLKYVEGTLTKKQRRQQNRPDWWLMGTNLSLRALPYINGNYYLLMTILARRDYLMEIGGFDCRFQQAGISAVELAIRLQNDGAEVIMGEKFMDVTHLPGIEGDHAPVHYAHMEDDWPLFVKTYGEDPSGATRTKVDFDNWKQAEEVWNRRFPGGKT